VSLQRAATGSRRENRQTECQYNQTSKNLNHQNSFGKSLKCPTFWPLSLIYPTFAKKVKYTLLLPPVIFGVAPQ